MKTKVLSLMLLAGGGLFAETHFSFHFGVGTPVYFASAAAAVRPPCPGPGYAWVDGYWSNSAWVDGYWAPPSGGSYFIAGDHDRRDRDRDRDRNQVRDRDRGRDQGRERGDGFRDRR